MSFRVLGTNHTSFTVSDLERSITFCSRLAHYRHRRCRSVIAFLKAPGHTLELIEYRAPSTKGVVRSRPCDTGFAHLALNVDDVPAAIAAPIAIHQRPNKGRDGITIELIEATPQ